MSHTRIGFRWQDGVNLLLGVWIGASPWLLGFAESLEMAAWNMLIVGGAIVVLAAIDMDIPSQWEEWGIVALGLWLGASTYLFGLFQYRMAATLMIATSIVAIVLGLWALFGNAGAPGRPDDPVHGH